ncbi:MAG TPA: DNA repair protein RecN, partial [Rhodanobacteraceae bacterium]|nr:DNA repair protein RecN [Rhodanobacteraceae bacterium]
MLAELHVRHFAVVDQAEIELGPGMTVVTGETGAGKSLLVDALLLLTGLRADASVVRAGCERAELSAGFDLGALPAAAAWLSEQAMDDAGQCQLRRVIAAEGGSRAWINGRPATLAQLNELGALLVEIHGQHEHQALLSRSAQLALLDAFGNHAGAVSAVAAAAHDWRQIGARIHALSAGADPAARIDWLEHQLAELDAVALDPAAITALEEEHRRLANTGQLLQGGAALAELLDGDSDFTLTRLVHRAHHEAQQLAGFDDRLAPLALLLEQAGIEIDEASDALARHQSALDLDPESLAAADAQLAHLHELSRKHRCPLPELQQQANRLREELEQLRGAGTEIEQLVAARSRRQTEWQAAAQTLASARQQAAQRLSSEVTRLMAELGMAGGRFESQLEPVPHTDPDPNGTERVEFLVSANPGQPARALRKVASGGELSRISLAIEVAALGKDQVGTMVFDEVDAGIGGAVAEVVGQKLRQLAGARQVLCVTHLPQVAAQGHAHIKVSKARAGDSTETAIQTLDGKARREEIAR